MKGLEEANLFRSDNAVCHSDGDGDDFRRTVSWDSGRNSVSDNSRIRLPHILCFSTLRNWLQLLLRYGKQIDPGYRWHAFRITLFVIATIPVRMLERVLFGLSIRRHQLKEPPVFIIGHWRSGTTNMHNLMLQDSQFASVTMLHCAIPNGFLTWGWLARLILKRRLPESRPMDAVPLGIDEPMSEDFALAGMTHMSHYLNYFFPRIAEETFRTTVLFEGVSEADRTHWKRACDYLLRKVSYACGGKRLLLKNPPNLGRISTVLEMYPNAKFIHVVRNPWLVHASTMKLMDRFTDQLSLQDSQADQLEDFVSRRYSLIMEQWEKQKGLIPEGQLVEVRHEEVTRNPVQTVEKIYQALGLNGWEEMKPALERYAESLEGYRTNSYKFDAAFLGRVTPYLNPWAQRFGYQSPEQVQKCEQRQTIGEQASAA